MKGCLFHSNYVNSCVFCVLNKKPEPVELIKNYKTMEKTLFPLFKPLFPDPEEEEQISVETQAIFVMESNKIIIDTLNVGIPEDWVRYCAYPTYFVCGFNDHGEPVEQMFLPVGIFNATYDVVGCCGALMIVKEKNDG